MSLLQVFAGIIFAFKLLNVSYGLNASIELNSTYLRVVTIVEPPYVYENLTCSANFTNQNKYKNCYTGFLLDLLNKMAEELDFNYTIHSETDYGKLIDGEWSGATGALQKKVIDVGLAAFSNTTERSAVVDFMTPFQTRVDTSSYTIALQKNSNWTKPFSHTYAKLVKQRYVEELKEIWWYKWHMDPTYNGTKIGGTQWVVAEYLFEMQILTHH